MYRLHNTSEHGSGVTNMYSISNAASRAATPLQIGGSDHLVLLTSTGKPKHNMPTLFKFGLNLVKTAFSLNVPYSMWIKF